MAACFISIGWLGDVYGEVRRWLRLAEDLPEREDLAVTATFQAVIAAPGRDSAAGREHLAAARSWTRRWTWETTGWSAGSCAGVGTAQRWRFSRLPAGARGWTRASCW